MKHIAYTFLAAFGIKVCHVLVLEETPSFPLLGLNNHYHLSSRHKFACFRTYVHSISQVLALLPSKPVFILSMLRVCPSCSFSRDDNNQDLNASDQEIQQCVG